jgi:hypothetical protein
MFIAWSVRWRFPYRKAGLFFLLTSFRFSTLAYMKTINTGIAQLAPVWLDRGATTEKMLAYISGVADQQCELAVFGEGSLPGYPLWLELTDGALFDSPRQKELYAWYAAQAVVVTEGLIAFQQRFRITIL